jgi:hypothetical protein
VKAPLSFACAAAALGVAAGACSEGEAGIPSLDEPLQVAKGQFIPGSLPRATTTPTAPSDGGVGHLVVTQAFVPNIPAFVPGSSQVLVSGRASSDAVAVGVRFADIGTGYWVVPMGVADQGFPGENDFGMTLSLNADDPAGKHDLLFVALDGAGNVGAQLATPLCIDTKIPDNQHACIPNAPLPFAVFSLAWDTNFDLDLHVIGPDGADLNAKSQPVLGGADAAPAAPPKSAPRFDRDSLGGCVADGFRQEDLYWPPSSMPGTPSVPEHGTYLVYVNPFAACGQPAVRFTFTLYTLKGTCPDCQLVAHPSVSGELLATQVTGGSSPSTYVTKYSL